MVQATAQTSAGRRPVPGRLPDMDDRQFSDWVDLIERRTGLCIAPERRSFLNTGIRMRMGEIGCDDYREYYRQLAAMPEQASEWSLLVDRLTVHETRFFRHPPSLALLRDTWLERLSMSAERSPLRAWSVGCATGEEAYTLAMLIDAHLESAQDERGFSVTGSDISQPAVARARAGVYDSRSLAAIEPAFARRYCRMLADGRFEIDPGLRERVDFTQLNLRRLSKAPYQGLDLVYCQNLLIYFDREQRADIAGRLAACLRPGGVLVLGPGELVGWQPEGMERIRHDDTLAWWRVDASAGGKTKESQ